VLIRRESDAIAMARPIRGIRESADAEEIRGAEEQYAVFNSESLASLDLVGDGKKYGVADQRAVHGRRRERMDRHGQPSNRFTAIDTLCPPNPKLLESAARTSRLAALFGVKFRSSSGSGVA
jgi:hypothetical protein